MTTNPDTAKALLNSGDFGDRIQGINQLRQLEHATAYDLLMTVVQDSNVRVRYAAVSMLANIGHVNPERTLPLLQIGLKDPEPDVQAAAADSLAALKMTEGFEDLQALYQSSQEWIVRFSIIAALGELGDRRAVDMLKDALGSGDVLLVPAAIGALGELGDPQAIPLILPFVGDADWQVRMRLVQSLANFDTPEVKAALEKLSNDAVEQVAEQAKMVLES
jgi:HEAT repeat protein